MATGNTIGKLTAEPTLRTSTPAGSANPPEKKSWWSKWGGIVHTGLDVLGAVPVIGIVADGANAAIYTSEGDYTNAAISGASAAANLIPGGGAAMKVGKVAVAVGKQATKTVAKEGAEALAKQAAKEAAEKAAKEAAEEAGELAAKKAGSDVGGGVKGKGKKKKPCKNKPCVGAPVNPVLGIKFLIGEEERDFELPAALPLVWQRSYYSDQIGNGWLGQGWTVPLATFLRRRGDALILVDNSGREVELPELDDGGSYFDNYESITLTREPNGRYRLTTVDGGSHQLFAPLDLDDADTQGERSNYLPLVALEDRNGNAIRIVYADNGLPAFVHDSAERMLGLAFDRIETRLGPVRRLAHVAELHGEPQANGNWPASQVESLVSYRYSDDGDLSAVLAPDGRVRREFRYRNHMLVEHSQPGGLVSRYEYDDYTQSGRVLRHATNVGQHWTFVYELNATIVTDNLERSTRYEYNDDDELVAVVDPDGGITRHEHNAWGKPSSVTDPAGNVTKYRYDAYGNTVAIAEPGGGGMEIHYDEKWQLPVAIIDASGATTHMDYDAAGNLVRRTNALGHVTCFNHDARGQIVRVTDAHGGRQFFEYDRFGQPTSHTDCVGHTTRYEWDSRGNQLALIQPDGTRTEYRYDSDGRLLRAHYADETSTRYEYDDLGRLIRHVNADGAVTEWELAADGIPVSRTDALSHRILYHYDQARRLIAVSNENSEHHRFAFDSRDNVVADQGFDGRVTRYAYDAAGRLVEKRELGTQAACETIVEVDEQPHTLHTRYRRNADGYLVEKIVGRAIDKSVLRTAFEYDAVGRLIAVVNNGGRVNLTYDELSQVTEESTLTSGHQRQVGYTYDRRLTQRYYGAGILDQLALDGDVISDIERDVMQRETVRSQGALTSYFDYDVIGRRVGQRARRTGSDHDVVARGYLYGMAGNVIAISDRRFGQTTYAYDTLGRITRANEEQFAFDPAHNIVDAPGERVSGNRVLSYEDKIFRFDTHGNLIEKRIAGHTRMRFRYDPEHRLVRADIARHGIKQTVNYGYDGFGRRNWKRDDFGTTEFVWSGDRLLQEIRRGRCLTYVYDDGSFVPIAQIEAASGDAPQPSGGVESVVRFFHNDQSGTPRELTNADGTVAWRANYRAWGNTLVIEQPEPMPQASNEVIYQPLRFQGQYFDNETGLHYNRFRYYDPDVGRYVSQDPIGLLGGINNYQYGPNPTGWIDPLGLACNPAKATHITYQGIDAATGLPYVGYASMPGARDALDILNYRYSGDLARFGGSMPTVLFDGYGQAGKDIARGLEQRTFEGLGGLDGTANKQNPVGPRNARRDAYLDAADRHLQGLNGGC